MIYKKIIPIVLTLMLACCFANAQDKTVITIDDFPVVHTLKEKRVRLPSLPPYEAAHVLRDSIVLVSLRNAESHHALLVHLKTGKLLRKVFPKGRGPGEFVEFSFIVNDYNYSSGDELIISDFTQNKHVTYHLDSLIKYGDITPPVQELICKSAISDTGIARLNNKDYVCFNPYYIGYGNYVNKGAPPLFRTNQALEQVAAFAERFGHATKYWYNTSNLHALYAHPKHPNIVLADCKTANIRIYDKKSLALKKEILGPDLKIPHLKRNGDLVFAADYENRRTYYGWRNCHTDDFIYLAYQHGDQDVITKPFQRRKKTSIFKIDWEGNLIACYHLNTRRLSDLSISKDGKILYGNTYKGFRITLLKYELP